MTIWTFQTKFTPFRTKRETNDLFCGKLVLSTGKDIKFPKMSKNEISFMLQKALKCGIVVM